MATENASDDELLRKESAESFTSEEDIPVGHGKESTLTGLDTTQLMELIQEQTRKNAELVLLKANMASEASHDGDSSDSDEDIPVGHHGKESTLGGMDTNELMELIQQQTRENASLELLKTLRIKKAKLLEHEAAAESKAKRKSGGASGVEDKKRKGSTIFGMNLGDLSFGKKASATSDTQRLIHLSELIDAIETYYASVQEQKNPKMSRKSVLQLEDKILLRKQSQDSMQLFSSVVMNAYRVLDIEKDWPHRGPSHVLEALEVFIEKFPGYQLQYKAEKERAGNAEGVEVDFEGRDVASMIGGPEVNTIFSGNAVNDLSDIMGTDEKTLSAHQRAPSSLRLVGDDVHANPDDE